MDSKFVVHLAALLLWLCAFAACGPAPPRSLQPKAIYFGQFGDKTYYTSESRVTQDGAESYCESGGMATLSMESQGEMDYLTSAVQEQAPGHYWTSARQKIVEPQHFYWRNTGVTFAFNHSATGFLYSYGLCVAIGSDRIGQHAFTSDQCDHLYRAMCQMVNEH